MHFPLGKQPFAAFAGEEFGRYVDAASYRGRSELLRLPRVSGSLSVAMTQEDSPTFNFDAPPATGPRPTGDPWQVTKGRRASVPVPLPVIMVRVEGSYTALDRKLWLLLLHNAWDNLDKPGFVHEASVAEVLKLFRQFGRRDLGQKGMLQTGKRSEEESEAIAIWQSIRRLVKTSVDWEDEEYQGIGALLADAMTNKAQRDTGRIYYTFSPQLAKNVLLPRSFARLRTHFIMGLRSKYAVTLYEILEGYINRREPCCTVGIDELRSWLKVPDDAYKSWKDLKRNVIELAIGEINDRADEAGFLVGYEGVREGKAFSQIRFTVTKTKDRQASDQALSLKASAHKRRVRAASGLADPDSPPVPSGVGIDAFRAKWPGADPYEAINRFQDKWRAEGCAVIRKPDAAFLKFCDGMMRSRQAQPRRAAYKAAI